MTEAKASAVAQVRILDDDTPTEDGCGGAHKAVAKRLARLLLDPSRTVRRIGLEGAWGSGKSTVLAFMAAELKEHEGTCLLTFDVWAHRGDDLRLAFLERLWAALGLKEGDAPETKKALDRLRFQATTTTKPEPPKMSGWGALMALSLVLAGAGAAAIRADSKAPVVVGQLLLATPLAMALLLLLYKALSEHRVAKHHCQRPSVLWASSQDVLGMLLTPAAITSSVNMSETRPRSALDIERVFGLLLGLATAKQRRFVAVLDNLDRLSADDAKACWSDLRVLTDSNELAGSGCASPLTFVIPMDCSLPARLWGAQPPEAPGSALPDGADRKPHPTVDSADAYRSKLLDVVLRVPPPLLSSWTAFLMDCLARAFSGTVAQDELQAAQEILQTYLLVKAQVVTPRSVKALVNDVAGAVIAAPDGVRLRHAAVYAAYRDKLTEFSALAQLDWLHTSVGPLLDDTELVRDLAAIMTGLAREIALEALVRPQLEAALAGADLEPLGELVSIPNFEPLVCAVINVSGPAWRKGDAETWLAPVSAVVECGLGLPLARAALRRHVLIRRTWPDLTKEYAQLLLALDEGPAQGGPTTYLVDLTRAVLSTPAGLSREGPVGSVQAFATAFTAFVDGLLAAGKAPASVPALGGKAPVLWELFVCLADDWAEIGSDDPRMCFIRTSVSAAKLLEAVQHRPMKADEMEPWDAGKEMHRSAQRAAALRLVARCATGQAVGDWAVAASEWTPLQGADPDHLVGVLPELLVAMSLSSGRGIHRQLMQTALTCQAIIVDVLNDHSLRHWALAAAFVVGPDSMPSECSSLMFRHLQDADESDRALGLLHTYGLLAGNVEHITKPAWRDAQGALLRTVALKAPDLAMEFICSHAGELLASLGEAPFLAACRRAFSQGAAAATVSNRPFEPSLVPVLIAVTETAQARDAAVDQYVRDAMQSVAPAAWRAVLLGSEASLAELLRARSRAGHELDLGEGLSSVLRAHAEECVQGGPASATAADLADTLSVAHRSMLGDSLLRVAFGASGAAASFWETYGTVLRDCRIPDAYAAQFLGAALGDALDHGYGVYIDWLCSVLEAQPDVRPSMSTDEFDARRQQITRAREEGRIGADLAERLLRAYQGGAGSTGRA